MANHVAPTLIGDHPSIQQIRSLIKRVAPSEATVMLLGESGTGKEVVARAIHAASARSAGPFVAVNCGAIAADLLESELFGHERGAFTGATNARPGLFQFAAGGTLLLDEIGELSPTLQVKLLRVLQERQVRPVGSDRAVPVDVRIIAATNQNLEAAVAAGRFRDDLFYRLHVIPIVIPPLRERRSDVPLLVDYALERLQSRSRVGPITISDEAMTALWEYDWPGNVRELENLIERMVVLAERPVIDAPELPLPVRAFLSEKRIPRVALPPGGFDLAKTMRDFEFQLIDEAVKRSKGNKGAAARLLGLRRTTLAAKLRRRDDDGPSEVPVFHEVAAGPAAPEGTVWS